MLWAFKKAWKSSINSVSTVVSMVPALISDEVIMNLPCFSLWGLEDIVFFRKVVITCGIFGAILLGRTGYNFFKKGITIRGHNYTIVVKYGDLYSQRDSLKLVSFDECFTTEVDGLKPEAIKPESVCGQFLLKHPGIDMDCLIKKAGLQPLGSKSRFAERTRYESCSIVPYQQEFLLAAFAKLDENGKGVLTRDEYIKSLFHLWDEIQKYSGQSNVSIPVLGSGITYLDENRLNQQELLDMIIATYKLSSRKLKNPAELRIICHRKEDFTLNKIGTII